MSALKASIVAALLAGLLVIPIFVRSGGSAVPRENALPLIIVTPHNEQIRHEFGRAFDRWHAARYGRHVAIRWNAPGGTSEIRRMLVAQYTAALEAHESMDDYVSTVDLFFGGGSFEHNRLKDSIGINVEDEQGRPVRRSTALSRRVDFDPEWLERVYGQNEIGSDRLYDPDQHWFGTALSGFGIVFNRDALREAGAPEPQVWTDLCDPHLVGWVAVGNPAHSGSIKKSFDTVLQRYGWERGWQILRRIGANARYFALHSLKIPVDVSMGDAAAGVCIDFYGRFEAQAIAESGDPDRVGYVDPPGLSAIDADPVSMLVGAPHPETARRFIEFCLTEQGQALWQFRAGGADDGLGPEMFELRRMPILRSMYRDHFGRFIDQVNPFELARPFDRFNAEYWSFIDLLFTPMAVENHDLLQAAWRAIIGHPAYPADGGLIVTATDVEDPQLREMLRLFDAMPTGLDARGRELPMVEDTHLGPIREGWSTTALWPEEADPRDVTRRRFARFFADNYHLILRIAERR